MRLKLLTYNLHKGMNAGNRRFVLHAMREALHHVEADLVLLQEVHGEHLGGRKEIEDWPDNNQLDFVGHELWPYRAYGKNAVYRRGHHGNAVLSKYPLEVIGNVDVSLMQRASRSLLHIAVEFPGSEQRVHVICVHLGLFGFERSRQLHRMVDHVSQSIGPDEPLVIAGDFNDWRGRASKNIVSLEGVTEAFHQAEGRYARTFPSWMPLLTMDRVYLRNAEVVECKPMPGSPWRELSDHIPLLVEIETTGMAVSGCG